METHQSSPISKLPGEKPVQLCVVVEHYHLQKSFLPPMHLSTSWGDKYQLLVVWQIRHLSGSWMNLTPPGVRWNFFAEASHRTANKNHRTATKHESDLHSNLKSRPLRIFAENGYFDEEKSRGWYVDKSFWLEMIKWTNLYGGGRYGDKKIMF